MRGCLFLIATPIGHLGDITRRALETLATCDAIFCEDTRRSSILLQRYQIEKPLFSYHQFKEKKALHQILQRLEEGETIGLISDAGTPCINDPGLILVQACIERKLPFTALPGPCSVIQALVLAGFESRSFQFLGFLPKKSKQSLNLALCYPGTTVCFESPERLMDTLDLIEQMDPDRKLAVVREMTKTFEECRRGTPEELKKYFELNFPKGEIVLVIAEGKLAHSDLDLESLIGMLQKLHGLSLKEAIKMAAHLKQIPKRDAYKRIHL